ncbi:MAG: hypothetical protein JSU91_04295 [Thermoplasmatales archaeon]|nr:MAG: hypothetical protein JSU91_04295 [Thermoplasmatales archaeon]
MLNEKTPISGYTHTVFSEICTSQNCKNCDEWSQNVYEAYVSGDYDFNFVEMIRFDHDGYVLNEEVNNWAINYSILAIPNSIFDGDFERIVGSYPVLLPNALNSCGNREVADITADMMVSWLGEGTIQVDITIENNENTQYNGQIRACITEIVSRYDTYYGNPYHFGFLDYAFNKDITISAGGIYTDSTIWNGNDHYDNHGDDFGDIDPDNIQVTMGVINDNNGFADESVMARIGQNNPPNEPSNPSPPNGAINIDLDADLSWDCSDPDGGSIKYDIYFGPTNPPDQVAWKQTEKTYDPGTMEYEEEYYWKIIAWDNHNASSSGPIWSFNVRSKTVENQAPEVEIIKPEKALYLRNIKILPRFLRLTKIIGSITVEATATDEDSGIEKVEFYINGILKGTDTVEPYTYGWTRDGISFFGIFFIRAIAYDTEGKTSDDWMLVRKIF